MAAQRRLGLGRQPPARAQHKFWDTAFDMQSLFSLRQKML